MAPLGALHEAKNRLMFPIFEVGKSATSILLIVAIIYILFWIERQSFFLFYGDKVNKFHRKFWQIRKRAREDVQRMN